MFSFLKKPYPYQGNLKRDLANDLCIGLFVAFFLIVFQPFGTNLWQTDNKLLKLAGFGLISFAVPVLVSVVISTALPLKLKEENWTLGSEIIAILFILLFIALGNLLYAKLLGIADLSFKNYLAALSVTLVVGVFPVVFHVSRKHTRLLQINLEQALKLNRHLQQQQAPSQAVQAPLIPMDEPGALLCFVAENEKHEIRLPRQNLLYVEAADNYCSLVYLHENKKKRELIRSSLRRLEGQISGQDLMRCHRAYLVNLHKIKAVEGNAAGYTLFFYGSDDTVPVSRNYIPALNERLNALK